MKIYNWFFDRGAKMATASGVAAILFAVYGASANAQTWNNSAGDGLWFNGTNWVGGTAPTGIADNAVVGAPAPVTLNGSVNLNSLVVGADGVINSNASLNLDFGGTATTTLNNAGTINMGNNTDLQFQNAVLNSGNININATSSATDIEIDSAGATLDGGGTVTLNGNNAGINGLGGSTLTIVDQTIQGQGRIGQNSIGISNQSNGIIDANLMSQTLQIDANATGVTNAGILQASNGGTLRVAGSVVDNTGGQIIAQDGSQVVMNASAISNGTLGTAGTGQLTVDTSSSVGFENVTINGTMVSNNNSDTEISGTINNTGTMRIEAGASSTDIEIQAGGATLTGGGTVELSGSNAGINGTDTLTIGDHTIEGQGSIGRNAIGIVNSASGLIDANLASQTLQIDTNASGFDNDGTLQASNMGQLRITGTAVDNDGGLIEAKTDSTVSLNASTITGGTLNSVGTGQLVIETGSSVRLQDLSNMGSVVSLNNTDTEISGTIANSGTMEIAAAASSTDIEVQAGGATLTGGGKVTLTGGNAGINGATGSVLTVGDQTIEGEGSIGENAIGVVNSSSGLINANSNGNTLNIDADATNNFVNAGTLRASDGGALRISATQIDNSNVIEALDGSKVELNNSSITGGTLRSVDSGTVDVLASTIEGHLRSFNNSDTNIRGTIENQGLIEILAAASDADIEIQTGIATLTGGGTVRLSGTNAGINGVSGTVLTIGDQVIEGQGSLGENTMGFINSAAGLVDANVSGTTLNIDVDSANEFTNNGTLQASMGGVLRVTNSQINNNSLIEAKDGSKVELTNSTITGGTLATTGSGTIDVLASASVRLENLTNSGRLQSFNNSDTEILGTVNNTGTMEILAGASSTDVEVQAGGATLTGGGTLRLTGTNAGLNGVSAESLNIESQLVVGQGSLGENTIDIFNGFGGTIEADVNGAALTIDLIGANSVASLINDGTLRASNGATLDSLQGIVNNGTINTDLASTVEAFTLDNTDGSLISGDGFIDVDSGTIQVAGTVAPGNSAGTLTLLDDTVFSSTALLQTELESASLFDELLVEGSLALDGVLSVDLLSGFNPLSSDSFLIASATDGITGQFSNVSDGGTLLTLDGEGTFVVDYTGSGVVLSNFSVSAIPEPSATLCLVGIGIGAMVRRRRNS